MNQQFDLYSEPMAQLNAWIAEEMPLADAMMPAASLATVDAVGQPHQRAVLLKQIHQDGCLFYTNQCSQKAQHLQSNTAAALHILWSSLKRQVNIVGKVEQFSADEAAAYFLQRPRGHQIASWASHQSMPIDSRALLETQFEEKETSFTGKPVPVPDFWVGYRLIHQRVEFWQAGAHRLHDRCLYVRHNQSWSKQRLQP